VIAVTGWHYQIVRSVEDGEERFRVHEAYPMVRGKAEPLPITERPVEIYGESLDDLRETLTHIIEDLDRFGAIEASDYGPDFEGGPT
jgi:hypothetical protein